MKKLFIVATPIGNLADITLRALETLKEAEIIIAEDTRRTRILLKHYEITDKKVISFHARSTNEQAVEIFRGFSGFEKFVYVSDAGTPGISDPGYRLIQAALSQGIKLVPIPGASALTTLISVAGVPIDSFTFHGFLPHKKGRKTLLESLKESKKSAIFYESVHRFPKLIDELNLYLEPERVIVVGRELTKMHEEIFRGKISTAKEFFTKENTKGEFVVIVSPAGFSLPS